MMIAKRCIGSWCNKILVHAASLCLSLLTFGQAGVSPGASFSDLVSRLNSNDINVRREALRTISDTKNKEEVGTVLIRMLNEENIRSDSFLAAVAEAEASHQPVKIKPRTENESAYYADLAITLARLKDKRALPVLIGVSGFIREVEDSIVAFGELSVLPLEKVIIGTKNGGVLLNASAIIKRLQREKGLTAASRIKLQDAILMRIPTVQKVQREALIGALGEVGDASAIGSLENYAQSDDYSRKARRNGKDTIEYPVRTAAQEAIRKIQTSSRAPR